MIDLLMRRYGDIETILRMDLEDGLEQLEYVKKKENEDLSFKIWLAKYPFMPEGKVIPFDEFYKLHEQKNTRPVSVHKRSAEDIISMGERIKAMHQAQMAKGGV